MDLYNEVANLQAKLGFEVINSKPTCTTTAINFGGKMVFVKTYRNREQYKESLKHFKFLSRIEVGPRLVFYNNEKMQLATEFCGRGLDRLLKPQECSAVVSKLARINKAFMKKMYPIHRVQDPVVSLCEIVDRFNKLTVASGMEIKQPEIAERNTEFFQTIINLVLTKMVETGYKGMGKFIVHGDLSPRNICVLKENLFLIDFDDMGFGFPGTDLGRLILFSKEKDMSFLIGLTSRYIKLVVGTRMEKGLFEACLVCSLVEGLNEMVKILMLELNKLNWSVYEEDFQAIFDEMLALGVEKLESSQERGSIEFNAKGLKGILREMAIILLKLKSEVNIVFD